MKTNEKTGQQIAEQLHEQINAELHVIKEGDFPKVYAAIQTDSGLMKVIKSISQMVFAGESIEAAISKEEAALNPNRLED